MHQMNCVDLTWFVVCLPFLLFFIASPHHHHHHQFIPLLVFSFPSFSSITHFVLEVAPGLSGVRVCMHAHISEWAMCSPEFLQKCAVNPHLTLKLVGFVLSRCIYISVELFFLCPWIIMFVLHWTSELSLLLAYFLIRLSNSSSLDVRVCIKSLDMQTAVLKYLLTRVALYMEHCFYQLPINV